MMAALPYIQLYVADYLSDTMHLNTEEHGAYLLLIMNYWQIGKPIPEKRLQPITRLSNDRWNSVKDSLREFFTENEQGEWVHARIDTDLDRVKNKSEQASRAGKASAAKRMKKKPVKSSSGNGRSKSAEQNSNHTDTDTDTDINKKVAKPPAVVATKLPAAEAVKIASFLADSILERDPKYFHLSPAKKEKTLSTWAGDIEKIYRLDGRKWEEIEAMVKWVVGNGFWCKNILSGKKLREKFSALVLQMQSKGKKAKRQSSKRQDRKDIQTVRKKIEEITGFDPYAILDGSNGGGDGDQDGCTLPALRA